MFGKKIFELYEYQRGYCKNGKNKKFSTIINRQLGRESQMFLDDLFYRISTDQIIDPVCMTKFVKMETHPAMKNLIANIDDLLVQTEKL
ncbi:MAG: hypothetical protein WC284_18340 [Candidimonas sp.]